MSSKICFMLLQISSNLFLPTFIKNNCFICKSCQDDPNIVIMPLNIIIIGHLTFDICLLIRCYIFYGLPALTTTAKIIILPLYSIIMPCKILIVLLNSIIMRLHIIIMPLDSIIMPHNIIIMLLNMKFMPLNSIIMPCNIIIMLLNIIFMPLHILIMPLKSIIMPRNIIIMLLNIFIFSRFTL